MLVFLGFIKFENMQIEGFFFYLLTGFSGAAVIHYLVAKVAYILEHDVDRQLAYDEGITPHEFEAIENLNRLSVWKRENKRELPTLK